MIRLIMTFKMIPASRLPITATSRAGFFPSFSIFLLIWSFLLILSGCATKKDPVVLQSARKRSLPVQRSQVEITTDHGSFVILLFHNEAPRSVENFRRYVRQGFYDNTLFHRVIPDFMVQGGGMTRINGNIVEKETHDPIRNEASNGLKNKRGTVAMARTGDRDSATAQFFVNLTDNPELDHGVEGYGYAVFGEVIKGMDVIDRIAEVPTRDTRRFRGLPEEDVVILSARALKTSEFVDYRGEGKDEEKEGKEEKKKKFLGIF